MTVEERRALEEIKQLRKDAALREVLSTEAGQELVWRLMTNAGVFGDTFDLDPLVHAHNAGKRAFGLTLMHEAQRVAPKSYLAMVRKRLNADVLELEAAKREASPGNTSTD